MNVRDKFPPPAMSRRQFMATAAAAGMSLSVPGLRQTAIGSTPEKKDKTRICIFSKHLQWLDYDAMAETAAEIGFDGVDLTVRPGGHVLPERVEEDMPRAVEAVKKAGLRVDMITTRITSATHEHTEPILRTAQRLGVGYYRMGYLKYDDKLGVAQSLEALKPRFRDLAALNEQFQIHGAYQNHSGARVGGPVWDIWYLLDDLDPRWMGCQYDIRHATVEGGYSWPLGLNLLAKRIKITAIKDFRWAKINGKWKLENCPLGEGMVDFESYFKLAKQNDISATISLHFEYPLPHVSEKNTSAQEQRKRTIVVMQKDLQKLRAMLNKAGL